MKKTAKQKHKTQLGCLVSTALHKKAMKKAKANNMTLTSIITESLVGFVKGEKKIFTKEIV